MYEIQNTWSKRGYLYDLNGFLGYELLIEESSLVGAELKFSLANVCGMWSCSSRRRLV